MAETAPLGDSHPGQRECSCLVGHDGAGAEILCNRPATHHVIYWWDDNPKDGAAGFDHGYCCDRHYREFVNSWGAAGVHEVNGACGMPGSRIHPSGPCWIEDLPVAVPTRTLAAPAPASSVPEEGRTDD